jgi:hypothetical protein
LARSITKRLLRKNNYVASTLIARAPDDLAASRAGTISSFVSAENTESSTPRAFAESFETWRCDAAGASFARRIALHGADRGATTAEAACAGQDGYSHKAREVPTAKRRVIV